MRSLQIKQVRAIVVMLLALALLSVSSLEASAHPLGNFTTNRYSRLTLAQKTVSLFYIVDLAEIPAYKAITTIDVDQDGAIGEEEQAHYLRQQMRVLANNLHLVHDGRPLSLRIVDGALSFPPGQGGLQTLRLEMELAADLDGKDSGQISYQDDNYPGMMGWREIVVQAGEGIEIIESSAPAADLSQALRIYPESLLQSPPALSSATIQFQPAMAIGGSIKQSGRTPLDEVSAVGDTANDPFADLIAVPLDGPVALALALLAAFTWGAAHALSPGHGKTIVAAYLIGARGTTKHAFFLGLTTTIMHTAGVFALGFFTLFASRFLAVEQIFPWLGMLSGLLVVGIGISLVWNRVRPMLARRAQHPFHEHDSKPSHAHPHHDHDHDHPYGHHVRTHSHTYRVLGGDGTPVTWRSLLALGVFGGLLPCPSALVVMLGAIALGRVALGLLLIVVFSLGLASVLTLIGVLMVHAGRLIQYIPEDGRLLRLAPLGSALFITLAGVGITVRALLQIGSLSL